MRGGIQMDEVVRWLRIVALLLAVLVMAQVGIGVQLYLRVTHYMRPEQIKALIRSAEPVEVRVVTGPIPWREPPLRVMMLEPVEVKVVEQPVRVSIFGGGPTQMWPVDVRVR